MIEVKNLTKKYGKYTAVDDISFTVNDGEIVGFLGPNGAGKTTTMNMMTGYISATNGSVNINGFDILKEPENAKKQIGYLPDTPPLYVDMRVCEYLEFVCDLKKVPKNKRKAMIDEICDTVKITDVKKRIIKNLSKGYKQRVGLAQALVGYPDVLILDEPTVGLDPKQIIEMRDVIKDLGERHTVILSSHILHEVSAVCDKIIIINNGKIVVQEDNKDSINTDGNYTEFMVRVKSNKDISEIIELLDKFEPKFKGINEVGSFDFNICIKQGDKDLRVDVFNILAKENIPIIMFKPITLSLEEKFMKVINNDYNEFQEDLKTDEQNEMNDDASNLDNKEEE